MGRLTDDLDGRQQQGKIIVYDYDRYLDTPEDACLYCLTDRQVAILLAGLEYTRWRTRWFSPSGADISPDDLEDWHGDLQARLMADTCDLTSALDEIKAQLRELNDMACLALSQANEAYRQQAIAAGNPSVPNQTFIYDQGYTTEEQQFGGSQGLCSAIYRYANAVFQDQLTRDGLAVSLIAAGTGLINPILGVISGGLGAILLADFKNAVGDQSAIDDVACCMYKALRDSAISQSAFAHSLDSCGFSFPNHNATLAGVLGFANQDTANYYLFIQQLRGEAQKATSSAPTDFGTCGSCTESCGTFEWDFRTGVLHTVTLPVGTLTVGTGNENGIKGVKIHNGFTGEFAEDWLINFYFDPPCLLDKVDYEAWMGAQYVGGGGNPKLSLYDTTGTLVQDGSMGGFAQNTLNTGTMTFSGIPTTLIKKMVLYPVRSSTGEADVRKPTWWHKIKVYTR